MCGPRIAVVIFFTSFSLCSCGGFSVHRPPELSDDETLYYENIACDYSLSIVDYEDTFYSDQLRSILLKSKCSNAFNGQTSIDKSHAKISIKQVARRNSSIPLLYILTFGIIPHFGVDEYGYVLKVTRSDGSEKVIDCTGKHKYILGWVALLYNVSPNWAMRDSLNDTRYRKRLMILIDEAMNTK
jgi:hypothetical protein